MKKRDSGDFAHFSLSPCLRETMEIIHTCVRMFDASHYFFMSRNFSSLFCKREPAKSFKLRNYKNAFIHSLTTLIVLFFYMCLSHHNILTRFNYAAVNWNWLIECCVSPLSLHSEFFRDIDMSQEVQWGSRRLHNFLYIFYDLTCELSARVIAIN